MLIEQHYVIMLINAILMFFL